MNLGLRCSPSGCTRLLLIRYALAVAFAAGPAVVHAWETDPKVVDLTPAISIGNLNLSRYILDKNYNQFLALHRGSSPTAEESGAWWSLFLAREALAAKLIRAGYLERSDVKGNVESMTRHAMTGIHGWWYQSLYDHSPISEDRLQRAYNASTRVLDAAILRFDDAAAARRAMGDATAETLAQRIVSIASRGPANGIDANNGRIVWPYDPFEEITDTLLTAAVGKPIGPLQLKLGVYYLLVRAETRSRQLDFDSNRAGLAKYLQNLDEFMVRRARRRRVLRESEFTLAPDAISDLSGRLLVAKHDFNRIPREAITGMETVPVASYRNGETELQLDVFEFARRFNLQTLPKWPTSRAEWASAVEDAFVEQEDWEAARRAGLDREPKFVQDRLNYALTQIRTAYEIETLMPKIAPTTEVVHAFYERNLDRYSEPADAGGTIYYFASRFDAAAAVGGGFQNHGAMIGAPVGNQPVIVRRAGPEMLPDVANVALIALPAGQPFGPVAVGDKQAVFVKRSTGANAPLPFGQIAMRVRRDLIQERLDGLELEMFARDRVSVRFLADLSKYGLGGSQCALASGSSLSSRQKSRGTRDARSRGEAVNTQPNNTTIAHE